MADLRQHTPPSFVGHEPDKDCDFLGAICLVMNPQSSGSIRLQSADPKAAPLIDANFLSRPWDRRVLIEGMRHMTRLLSAPVYAQRTLKTYFPADDSDEAVWVSIHMCCASLRKLIHSTGIRSEERLEFMAHVRHCQDGYESS
jgi:hypothetical protein